MPLLVHGIIEAATSDRASTARRAANGASPDPLVHRDLAGLVSETHEAEAVPSRANLLAHTRLMEAVSAEVAVIPMRFGVVVPDGDALIGRYLEPEHDRLRGMLDRFAGHVELRLRGRYDEEAVLRSVIRSDPRAARLRGRAGFDARIELGERIVAGIDARRARDADRVMEALGPYAADAVAAPAAGEMDAFAFSFLVPRDSERFDEEVDRLGQTLAPTVSLELVGPMPPFSFAASEAA